MRGALFILGFSTLLVGASGLLSHAVTSEPDPQAGAPATRLLP